MADDPFKACPDCGVPENAPCPGAVRPVATCDWKQMLGYSQSCDFPHPHPEYPCGRCGAITLRHLEGCAEDYTAPPNGRGTS